MAGKDLFEGISVFVGVVNSGSFTAAARIMGHSTSYVSKEITRLEKRLGSRLLNRTTRTISLTDAGKAYFERCNQIVIDAENAENSIGQLQESPRGLLKVSVPVSFGLRYLRDDLPKFMKRFPDVQLEVEFNDRIIDVVSEGYDIVIRIGTIKDSNLVARRFATSQGVVVASPDYLSVNGHPNNLEDLKNHSFISYSLSQTPTIWNFNKGGIVTNINITPRVICNSAELELSMALQSVGITRLPFYCCEQEIKKGTLKVILEEYEQPEFGVYVVYPHRQYLSAKVRVFVDYMVNRFS